MRLADFIEKNTEPILEEWVAFASTRGPAGEAMDVAALRDHAMGMLREIITDLRTPQTDAEQSAKSKGKADSPSGDPDTAAEVHGSGRADVGFSISEMVSEYRALRASVIRLWTEAQGTLTGADIDDLMRFNETIDQALAESTERFMEDIDRSREIFIGILSRDLRTPLSAVIHGSESVVASGELSEPNISRASQTLASARRMDTMVADLLDFTRGRLGSGVPVTRAQMALDAVVRQVVGEVEESNPDAVIRFTASGDMRVNWDAARIAQVVENLITNAVQHGTTGNEVSVSALGESADVVLRVHNDGGAIAPSELAGIFSPFKRLDPTAADEKNSGNLGLGLYIVERIVTAHNGTIDVRSSAAGGTLFTIRLPR